MKAETRIFLGVATFLLVVSVVYGFWTDADKGRPEAIGVTALILSGGLCLLMGSYFWFVSRRIDARPEDRSDAEIAEGAGELGFFSPGSYWPLGVALGAALAALGLAFWAYWLVALSGVAILFTVGGLTPP